jgi:NAD(P)-dependent dehydrogenase (short-subunit alcohol dehydrogenase family)
MLGAMQLADHEVGPFARRGAGVARPEGSTDMRSLHGKVVLITGASSGIGAALAREFAGRGAAVALLARRQERLGAIRDELTALGRDALAVACDVTEDRQLDAAVAATLDRYGRLDVAVANAGFGVAAPLERLTLADYRRQFETNVFGVLRTAFAVLEPLKASHGTYAIMGSVAAYLPGPGASPYCMSKAAVRALAGSLRAEWGHHGIAVVLVSPGYVVSEIRRADRQGRYDPTRAESIPGWLLMPTGRAARAIATAIVGRRREAVITAHGQAAVILSRLSPALVAWMAKRGGRRRTDRTTPGR